MAPPTLFRVSHPLAAPEYTVSATSPANSSARANPSLKDSASMNPPLPAPDVGNRFSSFSGAAFWGVSLARVGPQFLEGSLVGSFRAAALGKSISGHFF